MSHCDGEALLTAPKRARTARSSQHEREGISYPFTDLLGGQIATMFVPLGVALTLGGGGKLRAIGGSARERSPLATSLPSLHEQGLTGFDFFAWFSAWGPAGMPQDIVAKYNAAFREILAEPEVQERLARQGATPRPSTPQELDKLNREDYQVLAKLVKDARIKGD